MIVTFYCEDSQDYRQQLDEEKSCTVSIMGLSRSRCNICLYPYLISPATQKKCRGSLSHCDFGDPQTSPLAHQQHAQSNLHQWQLVHAEAVASGPPIHMHTCKQQRLGCWLSDPNLEGVNDLPGIPGCFVPHPLQMIHSCMFFSLQPNRI
mgnify:CR=1 FL=1